MNTSTLTVEDGPGMDDPGMAWQRDDGYWEVACGGHKCGSGMMGRTPRNAYTRNQQTAIRSWRAAGWGQVFGYYWFCPICIRSERWTNSQTVWLHSPQKQEPTP